MRPHFIPYLVLRRSTSSSRYNMRLVRNKINVGWKITFGRDDLMKQALLSWLVGWLAGWLVRGPSYPTLAACNNTG